MTTILQTPETMNETSKSINWSEYTNIDAYQNKIKEFRLPSYSPEAAVMGLLSEAGEVAAVFQKLIRGDYDFGTASDKLAYELGDILWHVAAVASDNDWNVSDLLQSNVDKLESRKLRQQIMGDGDNR